MATNCWKTMTKINGEESSRNRGTFDRLPTGTDREKLGGVVEKSMAPGAGCDNGEFLSIRTPQQRQLTTVNLSQTLSSKAVGFGISERDPSTETHRQREQLTETTDRALQYYISKLPCNQEMYTQDVNEDIYTICNKESVHTGRERNKLRTRGPRIWVCSSSGLADTAGNLEHLHTIVASATSPNCSFSFLSHSPSANSNLSSKYIIMGSPPLTTATDLAQSMYSHHYLVSSTYIRSCQLRGVPFGSRYLCFCVNL